MESMDQPANDDDPPDASHLQPPRKAGGANSSQSLTPNLVDHDNTEIARQLQRLADQEIINFLALQGFDESTPEWQEFSWVLAEYGHSVMTAWLVTGNIRKMAAAHNNGAGVYGLTKVPEGLRLSKEEAHDVAMDIVINAINKFRTRTLMHPDQSKRWNAGGGASLKTFFIGRCLMEFPDAYRTWAKTQPRHHVLFPDMNPDGVETLDAPDQQAITALETDNALEQLPHDVQNMFKLAAAGYKYTEIAELLSTPTTPCTEASVRSKMSRARNTLRDQR